MLLEGALLDAHAYALDKCVGFIGVGVKSLAHVNTEEASERLPESSPESTHKCLDNKVAALVGLTVDELDECLSLILGQLLHLGLVLVENRFLKLLEVFFLFLLSGERLQVLVGFLQRGVDELGIGQVRFTSRTVFQ